MTRRCFAPAAGKQRGAALLVAMIFMIVLMLIVASAVKTTNVNTQVTGNMQMRQEGAMAGQQMIESVISGDLSSILSTQTFTVDINDSGQSGAKYSVKVDAKCMYVKPISQLSLNIDDSNDKPCFTSGSLVPGMPSSGDSLCSSSVWDIKATSTSANSTQPVYVQSQGVTQRVGVGASC
ncbi:MAG: hypothetical protein WBC18_21055 [Ottowia sp.]|uniref:pilus assembly PilX family protein n=1 Tax=unclassified Ottowia TaxID=2645081 RepID=UPI003C2F1167